MRFGDLVIWRGATRLWLPSANKIVDRIRRSGRLDGGQVTFRRLNVFSPHHSRRWNSRRRCMAFIVLLALSACSAPALGQAPVFFDDFEGNALLPHWGQPPPSCWQYNVSNSMLNVTGLFCPSNPKAGGNYADLIAGFAP